MYTISGFSQNSNNSVLFIGNSLTKYKKNKMIDILKKFIKESDSDLSIDYEVHNGGRLDDHTQIVWTSKYSGHGEGRDTITATTMQKMINGHFNKIILQDPSWFIKQKRENNLYKRMQFINTICKENNIEVYIYQAYPRFTNKITYFWNCNMTYSKGTTDINKSKVINETYHSIKQQLDTIKTVSNEIESVIMPDSRIIPIGEILVEIYNRFPKTKMTISKTNLHPSKVIQYALALAFYTYLTGDNPTKLKYNYKINDNIAHELKQLIFEYKTTHNNL